VPLKRLSRQGQQETASGGNRTSALVRRRALGRDRGPKGQGLTWGSIRCGSLIRHLPSPASNATAPQMVAQSPNDSSNIKISASQVENAPKPKNSRSGGSCTLIFEHPVRADDLGKHTAIAR
jgi:hypothetical protein